MARNKKVEEPENHERWMVSYADFLTLLFAFFTCLYAMSTVDAQKMGKMVASMKESFGGEVFEAGGSTLSLSDVGGSLSSSEMLKNPERDAKPDSEGVMNPKDEKGTSGKSVLNGDAAMGRFKRGLEAMLGDEIKKKMVRIRMERRGIVVSLGENGMFDSGSDVIKPEGRAMLDSIATSLTSVGNQVRVEGHTDNVPISTERFPSNWELSTARATAVISRLVTHFGMSPRLLSAAGYGEYRPTAPNDTEEGRARNRRVDIIILSPAVARIEPR
ncbi:MAG: OmpA family protein [Acidobacteriota bacterium]|jgi:chemotaxis protein MotB|nr:OmpA family protein [Acidobacteriota bacterium]